MSELDILQRQVYTRGKNYRIDYSDEKGRDVVAVYVSSNALFYPHTPEVFREAVMEKYRYEWTRMKIRRAQKHIFIRDVYKQWYATGINAEINSIDKLIDWLKDEVKGYKCLIISGSSGGGVFSGSHWGEAKGVSCHELQRAVGNIQPDREGRQGGQPGTEDVA